MTMYEFDYERFPDGISSVIVGLDSIVWDRGYYCNVEDGCWYEVYVSSRTKRLHPQIDAENKDYKDIFNGFYGLGLDHYKDYGQITFFVPNGAYEHTVEELTEILT